ncbi:MAG: leucine--tRNA ligase [Christensenellaceae bacterium]|jgi:leucyl-tRNA synthetase|nr:leucine--tRNA ligase [Christensenellaceae bacterium]
MAKEYDFKATEKKWQDYWYNNRVFEVSEDTKKPKFYALIEFPYPSGSGLHLGHIKAFSSMEIIARKKRLEGYNVLFPIGYDAFGLPTENYAMRTKLHPRQVTDRNIEMFEKQLKSIGYSFCWERTVDTTDPDFYKWTQWIFLKMFEKGLAYKSHTNVNFCPECKVVLANEESQGGVCDRCGSDVVQREKDVWFLKIRDYAEKLLDGLSEVDFPERIKIEQQNWIGRSEGAEITFNVKEKNNLHSCQLEVYTTRPDTLYGVTFLVVSPEHPILDEFAQYIENAEEVLAYREQARNKKEFDRLNMNKEKTGVVVKGIFAKNPVTSAKLPIFTADYVMLGYGTGAIMAVPAHDQRDWDFAKKYKLKIIQVIEGGNIKEEAYVAKDSGRLINSPLINGLTVKEAIPKMTGYLKLRGLGGPKTDYKMKDWAFNRQRYWGEPIPIINCPHCGQVPVPFEELPLKLPELEDITPTDDASSPLSKCTDWVSVKCPKCGADAKRETDTMPQWAGSSWYFLRYMSPQDANFAVNPDAYKYWGQVDWYNGGMEHVTRHLIYSRFWNRFLYDIGVITHKEPYARRSAQGLILGSDGEKMSKSKGNTVDTAEVLDMYGADVLRAFILFLGDYEKPAPWQADGIKGCVRFFNRIWNLTDLLSDKPCDTSDLNLDALIKKVDDDYESVKFNTAIAAVMTAVNTIYNRGLVTLNEFKTILLLVYPIAPHMTSELYHNVFNGYIEQEMFPQYDELKLISDTVEIPVQEAGKLRGRIVVPVDSDEATVIKEIKRLGIIKNRKITKSIYVKNRIINLITSVDWVDSFKDD